VAAVFAIHPLRVESVAWVTERKDVLSGLFFVLTVGAYVRYARRPFAIGRYLLVLALFTLGLLSKAMLVTLPFILLLLDYWPLGRVSGAKCQVSGEAARPSNLTPDPSHLRFLIEKIPFLLLAVASCAVTVWAAKHSLEPAQALSFPWRVGNAFASYAAYLGQMLYPAGLAVLYPHPRNQLSVGMMALSAILLLTILAVAIANWRKRPYLLVGWLWYLGVLIPVIGLMQVGNQARADRFTYLPQIGLYVMLAWGAVDLCRTWRYRRAALLTAAGMILAGLLAVAYVQTTHWRDSASLWSHTVACTPENVIAHNNFGNALAEQGKSAEAIQHYERAIQLKPEDAEAYMNLGNRMAAQEKWTEAMQLYEQALERKPDDAKAHYNSGLTLSLQGKLDEAIPRYERAVRLRPDYVEAHNNLGNALLRRGRLTEAVPHYERVLELKPGFAEARYNLGNTLAKLGKPVEAAEQYERAIQLKPDYPEAHNNLGIAMAKQGKLTEALQHFQQALNLATAHGKPEMAEDIRRRMESYRASAPR
jgi:tetratricopeptide (TPR) repeat protein